MILLNNPEVSVSFFWFWLHSCQKILRLNLGLWCSYDVADLMYLDAGLTQGRRIMWGCMAPQGVFVFASSCVYSISIKLSVARLIRNCRQGTFLIKNICLEYFTTQFLFWRYSSFYLVIYLLNRKILLMKITHQISVFGVCLVCYLFLDSGWSKYCF